MIAFQKVFSFQEHGGIAPDAAWMPSVEEINRARRDLERRGVPGSLISRGSTTLVPAGEPPWVWLFTAGAWLVIWPAAIALRLSQGWWMWLPWWLPVVAALLHMATLVIPVLKSERSASRSVARRRFTQVRTMAQMFALEPDEFEAWVGLLFTLRGFEVRNTRFVADHGIDLEVVGQGVQHGLVQCKRYRGTVGEPVVRDLYGVHVHENADYSWLATTGVVSPRAREWAAGKPIELWDGQRLMELARQHR